MKIYDYSTGNVVEVTDGQFDFMQAVIRHSGRMDLVVKDFPISDEQVKAWQADPVFWPILEGHLQILHEARGLTPEYVKSCLLKTIRGSDVPTREQAQAINTSVKALGMGLQQRTGFNGKAVFSPENVTLEFTQGEISGKDNPA